MTTPPPAPAPSSIIMQPGWAHCGKCQGVFFGPNAASSKCPGGGQHDGGGSGDYALIDITK